MKGLAITGRGIEDVCAKEINGLIGAKTAALDSCVCFDFEKFEDLFLLCYRAQSVMKVMLLLGDFEINSVDDIKPRVPCLSEWIGRGSTFAVRCWNLNSEIITMEVEQEIGEFIFEKSGAKVSLNSPDTTFFVFIAGKRCFVGIDFSGEDLSKRDYRLFTGSDTIKATTAYSLVRIAGFKDGDVMLDPFCFSGAVPVEAALFASNLPVNHFSRDKFIFRKIKKFSDYDFDSFFDSVDLKAANKIKSEVHAIDESVNAINSARKNAKIAGVNKLISFSRKETGWLELKFRKESVDQIITHAPELGKSLNGQKALDAYEGLFWQAVYILKKGGVVAVLTRSPGLMKKAAEKHKFALKEERKIMQGQMEFYALVFVKD